MIKPLTEVAQDAQEVLLRVHAELDDDSPLRSRVAMVYIDLLQCQIEAQLRQFTKTGFEAQLTKELAE